jgi:hypothetical protein
MDGKFVVRDFQKSEGSRFDIKGFGIRAGGYHLPRIYAERHLPGNIGGNLGEAVRPDIDYRALV